MNDLYREAGSYGERGIGGARINKNYLGFGYRLLHYPTQKPADMAFFVKAANHY